MQPFIPQKFTYPRATINAGTQSGMAESDKRNLRPKKFLRDVKNAAGIPMTAATKVDNIAILSV